MFHLLRFATAFNFNTSRLFRNSGFQFNTSLLRRGSRIPLFTAACLAFIPATINLQEEKAIDPMALEKENTPKVQPPAIKTSIWTRIWHAIVHTVRFLQLVIIFIPPIVLSPLLLIKWTRSLWMDIFVKSIEKSGVVFIKAFQYLSHRRDIIGPELAAKFQYLRENAPTHSLEETKQNFKEAYGKDIYDIFEQFDPVPIASGSVSQVYKAIYKGKKVAVKVRHPNVDKYIQRDINLLFFLSYIASLFSPAMQIPVSSDSLKKTLTDQIDFTFQMRNLNIFNKMFKENRDVNFPSPFEESTKDSVLVETFIEGVPVSYYETNKHPMNRVIAHLGSTTFFQMLMKNNFIHADCHGGNIFVQIKDKSYNFLTEIRDCLKDVCFTLETKFKVHTFDTEKMRQLYLESRKQEQSIRNIERKSTKQIVLNILDAGMVIELNERDKRNFVNFIKSIVEGRGQMCAQMIYNLSNFEGKKIHEGNFESYHKQLSDLFSVLDNTHLNEFNVGMQIFIDMLTIIRQNKMKLDGQFATLLTNMVVLEAIARDIDPEINIFKCAFPYFKYVDDFGVYSK